MLSFLCNPFNDPNDPWYYVIGALFLLLIFGALALYMILSKKKKDGQDKSQSETADKPTETDTAEPIAEQKDGAAEQAEETDKSQDGAAAEENKTEE